ncbi:MAG TPA: phage tail protein [Cyclobacteriaceae bacterium]|nr:phage tail protein [Cyclobacteriaceae bacterium]
MTAVSLLARCVLGTGIGDVPLFVRLPCTPIVPPSLAVTIGEGACYTLEPMDSTAWSVIPADTDPNHNMFKQGWLSNPANFLTPAPTTSGNSVIHLIQARFQEMDVNNVSRPYFNSADPSMPIFNNNFDTRQDTIDVQIKLGIEASVPAPPTPDPGYTALYYVTVAYGQTSIVSGNISVVPGAPFITESLTQKISSGTIAAGYVSIDQEQKSSNVYANDIGTPGVLVVNPNPAYAAYQAGMRILVQAANANGGVSTLNVSGQGAVEIKMIQGGGFVSLSGGEIQSGAIYEFIYNGSIWQIMNPTTSGGIPVGTILPMGGTGIDAGFLAWNGQIVSRTTYAALFAKIGVNWGAGDGSTTFQVGPTTTRRTMVGAGGTGTSVLGNTVGSLGGSETHALTGSENGPHTHNYEVPYNPAQKVNGSGSEVFFIDLQTGTTTSSGSGTPHNIMQPSMVVFYQVKY